MQLRNVLHEEEPEAEALGAPYTRLGNGGYAPDYGLLGLSGGAVQEDRLDAICRVRALA